MNSLSNLFKKLDSLLEKKKSLKTLQKIVETYNGNDYLNYVKDNDKKYNRNTVFINENLELVVITWLPNQHTTFHKHPKNGCIFKVLEGKITENLINLNDDKINSIYQKNDISYIDNLIGIHKMNNNFNKRCISLHIYSPPFKKS